MYEYEVTFYEEIEPKIECGIVAGKDYSDAITNLVNRFQDGNIVELSIVFLRSEPVLPYTTEAGATLRKYFEEE